MEIDEQPSTVYYEIFVRSFYDSNGDGIGDLRGVIEKLDYLNDGDPNTDTDLGIGGIWLMPVNPSPSYHGYDITDFYGIDSEYGTVEDFGRLIEEAHRRGIKVIMDMVFNHTSLEHPWFADSRNPDSKYRSWYYWMNKEEDTGGAASAAGSGDAWHTLGGGKYLGIFSDHMPDLNYDNPEVRQEMIRIGKFWLEKGVDGFRLDAAKHIYIDTKDDVTAKEKLDKNIAWWNEFREAMNEVNPGAYIVGEMMDKSPAIIAPYLQPFDSGFNFGLAEQLVNMAKLEQSADLGFTLKRTYDLFARMSDPTFVDAPFLTNHDQTRAMSTLYGNVERAKSAASLLLSLPGNPFIYYGEEIGMQGMKPDEFVREPMVWYDKAKAGQTSWEPSKFNLETPSVERQLNDPQSLLSHYRKWIGVRNKLKALRDGGMEEYESDNMKLTAFIRATNDERVLVVHNTTGDEQKLTLAIPNEFARVIMSTKNGSELADGGKVLVLPSYSSVILGR
ncbi:alpha-amylase [Paenibacillus beijingensis]|uniref:Alpha-amylase n=1 Tax=Paenibacillus beijingensis TaxID=1126833 RepID=A0A0D5NQ15_9BACL|nr:alpha-amylase [Paenibacillus beijingensis]